MGTAVPVHIIGKGKAKNNPSSHSCFEWPLSSVHEFSMRAVGEPSVSLGGKTSPDRRLGEVYPKLVSLQPRV